MLSAVRVSRRLRSASTVVVVLTLVSAWLVGVAQPAAAAVLTLRVPPLPDAQVGAYYYEAISATGGTGAVTLTVSGAAGTGTLSTDGSGTDTVHVFNPTAAGTYSFHVHAVDSAANTADQDYTVKIYLGVSPPDVVDAVVDVAYGPQAFTASGGTPPYTWTVASGALPTGLTLSAGGSLSGTPTAVGTYFFTLKATDSAGAPGPNTGFWTYEMYVSPPSACDAVAGNIVQNCGFETGDDTGWTRRANHFAPVDGSGDGPATGAHYLSFGNTTTENDEVTQTLTGYTAGATYDVSFRVNNNYPPAEPAFFVTVEDTAAGTVTLLDQPNPANPDQLRYVSYTGTFQASNSTPPTIVFAGRHDAGWMDLDDVVVKKQPPTGGPPGPTVTVTSSKNASLSGDPVTFTATLSPVPDCGSVSWLIDSAPPPAGTPSGGSGATWTLGPISSLLIGTHPVTAVFSGCATAGGASGTVQQEVDPTGSGSSPTASPTPSSTPTASPTATPTSGAGPTITSHLSSAQPVRHGWYRSPVTVTFTCTAGSAALAGGCPAPVTLSNSGAGQKVTRTITDAGGKSATATVVVNLDREPPTLSVHRDGRTLSCETSDELSGLAVCTIHRERSTRRGVRTVRWTATATDDAGNTTTQRGKFSFNVA